MIVFKKVFIITLSIIFELFYVLLCLISVPQLLRAIFILPSLFIIPGMLLSLILRGYTNDVVKLIVEGFFVSTLIITFLTSIFLMFGFSLTPLTYSLSMFIFVLFLSVISLIRKIELKLYKLDALIISMAFLSYILLLEYFSRVPRLPTPDETSYVFSARLGMLNGFAPPMGVRPDSSEIRALFQGRYFWIYLLISFLGSTNISSYQAGLLSTIFLPMIALASSLFVEDRWLRIAIFMAVSLNPLLLIFSALALNDLAISFYIIYTILLSIKSLLKENRILIDGKTIFYFLIGLIITTLIKPNVLAFISMWIILIYVMLRYKLYKQGPKYKVIFIIMILPVIIYELFVDIPYIISTWILKSKEISAIFEKVLILSPAEYLIRWFLAPWWSSTAHTLLSRSFPDLIEYYYKILSPESLSLPVSSVILALPLFIFSRRFREKTMIITLSSLALLSLYLFYFNAVVLYNLNDASRYSLWMIPIWISLTLIIFKEIFEEKTLLKTQFFIIVGAIFFLFINLWLSKIKNGIYIGYSMSSRLWTMSEIIAQLILLIFIFLFLQIMSYKKRSAVDGQTGRIININFKQIMYYLVIILILLNEAYFFTIFVEKSLLYKDHGFNIINNALSEFRDNIGLIFANNYIYMRYFVDDKIFQQGLLLPLPDTKEEFLKLIEVVPSGTLFLISTDKATTWYEYANKYIKDLAYLSNLTSNVYISKINELQLPKGKVILYKIEDGDKNLNFAKISVENVFLKVGEKSTITLFLKIYSSYSNNVSIIVGTDRFTKLYSIHLNQGLNYIKFDFDYVIDPTWYEPGGVYWVHLAQTRVLVIEDRKVCYNTFLTPQNLILINLFFISLILLSTLIYFLVKIKYEV